MLRLRRVFILCGGFIAFITFVFLIHCHTVINNVQRRADTVGFLTGELIADYGGRSSELRKDFFVRRRAGRYGNALAEDYYVEDVYISSESLSEDNLSSASAEGNSSSSEKIEETTSRDSRSSSKYSRSLSRDSRRSSKYSRSLSRDSRRSSKHSHSSSRDSRRPSKYSHSSLRDSRSSSKYSRSSSRDSRRPSKYSRSSSRDSRSSSKYSRSSSRDSRRPSKYSRSSLRDSRSSSKYSRSSSRDSRRPSKYSRSSSRKSSLSSKHHRKVPPVEDTYLSEETQSKESDEDSHQVKEYFKARKHFDLSALGRYLFLNETPPAPRPKKFKILMWEFGEYMEQRQLYYFHDVRHEPFETCSVNNCYLDYNDSSALDADAVLVQLHRLNGTWSLPQGPRPPGQRWVFITDESPFNTFNQGNAEWPDLVGLFNWSMSYKAESDVPVAYGRTIPLVPRIKLDDSMNFQSKFAALVPYAANKTRDVLVAIMMSNCGEQNERLKYVKSLQKYIDVDFYGNCGTTLKDACPGFYGDDCPTLGKYLFYLAFENSNCDQYITEKAFSHGYRKGAVPIIMGCKSEVSTVLLPPDSFFSVSDFKSPKDLANVLLYVNATFEENYLKLHEWRKHYEVVNEHGYFNAPCFHYCRVCEALNYNDESPKVYGLEELRHFLDSDTNCYEKP